MPSITTARDEMLARLKAVVDGISAQNRPVVVYDDAKQNIPDTETTSTRVKPWIRAKVQHAAGRQASLANAAGQRRWERTGFLVVQLFTALGEGQNTADLITQAVMDGFDGYSSPSGVWFRNARSNEVGSDGTWYQTNIFVDFEYDEVK